MLIRQNELFKRSICVQISHYDHLQLRQLKRKSSLLWEQLLEPETKLAFFTLLNELSGDYIMRTYLIQNKELIEILINCILNLEIDTEELQNAVGILQKLSLKVEAQDLMVSKGIIKALFIVLDNKRGLMSEYTLEYALALLMNLSLNPKAKIIIEEDVELNYIKTLMELWEDCPSSIHHFLNATIYSFLWSSRIQEKAREIDLIPKLQKDMDRFDQNIKIQIDYIIKRMNGESVHDSLHSGKDIVDIDGLSLDIIEQIIGKEFVPNPYMEKFMESYSLIHDENIKSQFEVIKEYFDGFVRNFSEVVSFNITSNPYERRGDVSLGYTGHLSYTDKPVIPVILNDKFSTFSYSQISEINTFEQTQNSEKRKYIKSRFGTQATPVDENGDTPEWEQGFQSKIIKVQRTPIFKNL
jgi:hypothetical protein